MRINVELDTGRPRQDGTCRVRLTFYRRKLARHALDLHVDPRYWDRSRRRVKFGSVTNWHLLNGVIDAACSRAEELAMKHPSASPGELAIMMRSPDAGTELLTEVLTEDLSRKHSIAYGTRKGRVSVINDLRACLPLSTLQGFGTEQVEVLSAWYWDRGLKSNTVRSRLRRLRTMLRSACKRAGVKAPDFDDLIPAEEDTGARYLTAEELRKVRAVQLHTRPMEIARDAWLVAYNLGGLRFGDVCRLQHTMRTDTGWEWVAGKVLRQRWAPHSEEVDAIARKWSGSTYVVPLITEGLSGDALAMAVSSANAWVNRALKDIARLAGVRPITTHSARHTWANEAKRATGDIHAVSRILGHARTSTTERYLSKFDRDAVAEVFRKMDRG